MHSWANTATWAKCKVITLYRICPGGGFGQKRSIMHMAGWIELGWIRPHACEVIIDGPDLFDVREGMKRRQDDVRHMFITMVEFLRTLYPPYSPSLATEWGYLVEL